MKILAIGDIVGRPGRRIVASLLPDFCRTQSVDFVVANAENAAGGIGCTLQVGTELFAMGIDVLTMGNHAWGKKEAYAFLDSEPRVIRPANYPEGAPGRGWTRVTSRDGIAVGVINLEGRVFAASNLDCPFRMALKAVDELSESSRVILVDFHGEATSEKIALGRFLDGKVSAVFGTHTHVLTCDAHVLPGGTAYITDLGMTGPIDSVIGIKKEIVISRFMSQLPAKFEVAQGPSALTGALFDIDEATGLSRSVETISLSE